MAIRILGHNVGEEDVAQPGDVTTLRWELSEISLIGDEEVTAAVATAVNRAGVKADIIDAEGVEDGLGTNSVAFVRIHNLVDGERYKVKLVATITENVKVVTVIIFVPVVAP